MKRLVSALLTAALLVGTVGCAAGNTGSAAPASSENTGGEASAPSSESDTSVSGSFTFLSWYNETQAGPILKAFNAKYPNIKIDFEFAPPVKDYVEKLSTMMYSGSAPDIFQMALENREDIIKGNYAEDLSNEPYMKDGTIPDNAKDVYSSDGKVLALAIDGWVGGLFYNKSMFEKAGIQDTPQSWDELMEDCQKLKDAGFTPLMDNCQDAAVNLVPALVGAQTISKDPDFMKQVYAGTKTFSDGWDEPLQMWHGLVQKGFLNKDMAGITNDQMLTEFATEQVAMIPSGPWNNSKIKSINPDLDYECMGIPGKEKGNVWYDGAIDIGFCVNSSSPNKDLAKKFLAFIASPEGQKAHYEGYGSTIIAKGYDSPTDPVMEKAVAAFKDQKTYIPMGDWTSYSEAIRNVYLTSLQDCLVGKIQPDDVSKNMQKKLDEMSEK